MFYDRFAYLCKQKGVSVSRGALEAGISKSLVTKWKTNNTEIPSPDVISKLSKYFGLPVSELLGEEPKKAPTEDGERSENGDILEGKVDSVVNGGVIVTYKSFRVFVPASLANDRYLSDLNELVGKIVPFKIIDVNERRKRIVGNVKTVLTAQKQELEKAFWEGCEIGKKYNGIVKSLTSFGAFVDIGFHQDGLVHISEI